MNIKKISGRLTMNPVIRQNHNDKKTPYALFTIAENFYQSTLSENGKRRYSTKPLQTSYYRCIAYGDNVKVLSGMKKGERIEITNAFNKVIPPGEKSAKSLVQYVVLELKPGKKYYKVSAPDTQQAA